MRTPGRNFRASRNSRNLRIFFVDGQNLHASPDRHIGERDGMLRALQPRQPSSQRHTMRAGAIGAEAADQQILHFRREAMLEALGGGVRKRPVKADHVGQELFGQLMAQRQPFGFAASFSREANVAIAFHAQQAVASHALERGGHRGRRDFQFFREPRANRGLIVLFELPDRLQIIFAGDAR